MEQTREKELIKYQFNLKDTKEYLWRVEPKSFYKGRSFHDSIKITKELFELLCIWFFYSLAPIAFFLLLSIWYPKIAFILGVILCFVSIGMRIRLLLSKQRKNTKINKDTNEIELINNIFSTVEKNFSFSLIYHMSVVVQM